MLTAMIPNITGSTAHVPCFSETVGGAFYFVEKYAASAGTGAGWEEHGYTVLDASRCSIVYKTNCKTVQPPAINAIIQVRF